ncbi:MAG: manganese efflux pump [Bacilli bacterium]|nr:manganese efflux pump [Bacilli bacterium]
MYIKLIYFFIGISLSMDAFSLAISIGTLSPTKIKKMELITTIGIFHFIMPYFGSNLGNYLKDLSMIPSNYIVAFIFITLGIEMIKNKDNENQVGLLTFLKILFIGLTVSVDALLIGIAIGIQNESPILGFIIISVTSMIFTYLGLKVGTFLSSKDQEKGKIIGIIVLFLLGLKNLFGV